MQAKFTHDGGVEYSVEVSATGVAEQHGQMPPYVRVCIGVYPAYSQAIFDPQYARTLAAELLLAADVAEGRQ